MESANFRIAMNIINYDYKLCSIELNQLIYLNIHTSLSYQDTTLKNLDLIRSLHRHQKYLSVYH